MEAELAKAFAANAIANVKVDPKNLSGDMHAAADYRAHLIGVMAQRAVAVAP
jgi:aerobic carbon-monoxide dehydrogenase medium subunit